MSGTLHLEDGAAAGDTSAASAALARVGTKITAAAAEVPASGGGSGIDATIAAQVVAIKASLASAGSGFSSLSPAINSSMTSRIATVKGVDGDNQAKLTVPPTGAAPGDIKT